MKLVAGAVVVGVLVTGVVSSSAQSLADVARQEEARRAKIKERTKVYTDADVAKYAPVTASAQQQATTVTDLDANGEPASSSGTPTDEAAWRARLQTAREGLDRDKLVLNALEKEARAAKARAAKGVEEDIDGAEDPNAARTAEIARLKAQMEQHRQTLENAEEDARKAGVPPGWVR